MMPEDRLFEEAFRGELEMQHQEHPGFSVLWQYAATRLDPELTEKISVHVATCKTCAAQLRELREEQNSLWQGASRLLPDPLASERPVSVRVREALQRWAERIFAPKVFYRHAVALAALGALVLLLNYGMNQLPTLSSNKEKDWWALWILIPWGILLLLHGLRAFFRR